MLSFSCSAKHWKKQFQHVCHVIRIKQYNRAPVDKATRKLIRRKSRLWTRYMETKYATKYDEYCKCRNKVRSITRSIRRTYEKRIVLNTQTEPKHFGDMQIQS